MIYNSKISILIEICWIFPRSIHIGCRKKESFSSLPKSLSHGGIPSRLFTIIISTGSEIAGGRYSISFQVNRKNRSPNHQKNVSNARDDGTLWMFVNVCVWWRMYVYINSLKPHKEKVVFLSIWILVEVVLTGILGSTAVLCDRKAQQN